MNDAQDKRLIEISNFEASRTQAREAGIPALHRLFKIANRNSGQPQRVAEFLLSLYNYHRFSFNLRELRGFDGEIVEDCLKVLKLDSFGEKDIENYFENGSEAFENLAKNWGICGRTADNTNVVGQQQSYANRLGKAAHLP